MTHGKSTQQRVFAAGGTALCGYLVLMSRCWGDALPPPPDLSALPGSSNTDTGAYQATLFLELTINGVQTEKVVPVRMANNDLQIQIDDLLAGGIRADALPGSNLNAWLPLASHPDIHYVYDNNALVLELSVPTLWLNQQRLGRNSVSGTEAAVSGQGLLLNYDFYVSHLSDYRTIAALWSEQRAFTSTGVLTNTGAYRRYVGQPSGLTRTLAQEGYIRYDTQWLWSEESSLVTVTVGDLITGAQSWSAPVRMGGVRVARDFRLRPDLITYPLPEFAGQSAIPATVDLFMNGYRTRSEHVQPGPFTITDMPFVSGAGQATIVTTDVLGRQVATTLPFYVSSDLLQHGLNDYAISIGALRRRYGVKNFSYGSPAATVTLRHGVSDVFTAETQLDMANAEAGGPLILLGAGSTFRAGLFGIFNAASNQSNHDGTHGWQHSFGYRYATTGFSIGYQGMRSTANFRNLTNIDALNNIAPSRASNVFTASASGAAGTAGLGYIDLLATDNSKLRLLNLSFTRQFSSGVNFYAGFNHDLVRDRNSFAAQLMMSFGRNNITAGIQHDTDSSAYLNYTHSAPAAGGLGWNTGYARSDSGDSQQNAALAWNNTYSRIEAGLYNDADQHLQWANLRGSLVMMDGHTFATRQINDAFALVSTDGIGDVPVHYENQLIGRTNKNGYLLVPSATSYYAAKYEIDTLELPTTLSIADFEKRLVLKRGSGSLLRFAMQPITAATITLVDENGILLPVGSTATETFSKQSATVGYDGLVYFEGLGTENELVVVKPNGTSCRANFQLSDASQQTPGPEPLTCE